MAASSCDWIAVDWGTSRLRAWAMAGVDRVCAAASSDEGMNRIAAEAAEGALLSLVAPWLGDGPMEVIACGMVGSRFGWIEAPYRAVPCTPVPEAAAVPPVRDARLRVGIVPGLMQRAPADVIRGEETQIAGWLAARPGFDGVLCLPGTHSKWVHVSAGEVVSFRTAMTGEMFDLLAGQSVLRHSVAAEGWDADAFAEAVASALSRPEKLAGWFFGLRAEALLADLAPETARARLSGLLIGAELAAMRPYWLGQDVVVIGAGPLAEAYGAALRLQGSEPAVAEQDAVTLAGLAAIRARLARS